MKALSIMLPWGLLIVAGREKTIEVRNWSGIGAAGRLIGQRIAIHCGKKIAEDAPASVRGLAYQCNGAWQGLRGCIIGTATLVDAFRFTERSFEELAPQHLNPLEWWEEGMIGLEFADPMVLAKPIPWRGQLGFFEVGEVVARRLG